MIRVRVRVMVRVRVRVWVWVRVRVRVSSFCGSWGGSVLLKQCQKVFPVGIEPTR